MALHRSHSVWNMKNQKGDSARSCLAYVKSHEGPVITPKLKAVVCLNISLNRGCALWEDAIAALKKLIQNLLKSVIFFHSVHRSLDDTQRQQVMHERQRVKLICTALVYFILRNIYSWDLQIKSPYISSFEQYLLLISCELCCKRTVLTIGNLTIPLSIPIKHQ